MPEEIIFLVASNPMPQIGDSKKYRVATFNCPPRIAKSEPFMSSPTSGLKILITEYVLSLTISEAEKAITKTKVMPKALLNAFTKPCMVANITIGTINNISGLLELVNKMPLRIMAVTVAILM
ncbi:hypothetical protein D3C75_1022190 [compost metagenome]